jgi:hypothetical protein
MDKYDEIISKKKIAIDILLENKTDIAIEWFSKKDVDDFITLETYKDYSDLCFKYSDNEYKIQNFGGKFTLSFNKESVLRVHYSEKNPDGKIHHVFDWDDHNSIQTLKLYDWVEELPVIMKKEIEGSKTKKTKNQIKYEKEQEQARIRHAHFVDENFSLGKYADPKSEDYKDYLKTARNKSGSNIKRT